jgi:hypothetical protein
MYIILNKYQYLLREVDLKIKTKMPNLYKGFKNYKI